MQKLDFNKDGKLVAYTDNGCTDGKSATTEVKGTFEVSADVVNFILAKEYDLPATTRIELEKELFVGHYHYKYLYCVIGNDEQQSLLQKYNQRVDEQQKELESYRHMVDEQHKMMQEYRNKVNKLSNVENELKRLRKAVDDFNKNARFYERKIKI